MRLPSLLALPAILLIFTGSLLAQTTPIVLDDGLTLTLPPGWVPTLLDTAASSARGPVNFEDPQALTLLLHARPGDGQRQASLTIVRDNGHRHAMGPMAMQDLVVRLSEIAAEKGYRAEKFTSRGNPGGPDSLLMGEISSANGSGQRRTFASLAINRFPTGSLRFYWQADEADPTGRQEFENLLASMTFQGTPVSASFSGSSKVANIAKSPSTPLAGLPSLSTTTPPVIPAPTATPGPPSAAVTELLSKNHNSLVVIEGQNGVGSGFVCQMDGQPTLLTNTHVLSNNPQPRFSTLNGTSLTPGLAFVGMDSDLSKIALPADTTTNLELLTELDSTVRVGDAIAVLGNAEGAGVVKPLEGRIVGIGPNLIEVDAPFVPGNSGSPIIHVPTGKVIGIATYLLVRKVNSASGAVDSTVRRFGYRLDKVKGWEPINWQRFYLQSGQLEKIENTSAEFIKLFADAKARQLSAGGFTNPGIRRALDTFERSLRAGSRMSAADLASARRQLLGDLRSASISDINAFDSRTAYDYFRRMVAEEKKMREEIHSGFTRAIDSVGP